MRRFIGILLIAMVLGGVAFGHGMSAADQELARTGTFNHFFMLGAKHMVTGYDHLLFLFGVLFFLTKFKDIFKFVTAFTIGHSITLIVATFAGISANYYLVDTVIALTVCYKGFDNLDGFRKYFGIKAPHLSGMVFSFGLIHGFGLSTRLQQLTIGSGMDLLGKIIAFNIGVEAGQIAALVVILAFLSLWHHTESFKKFSIAANTALIVVGALLAVMQLHSYTHQVHSESYPINQYNHEHVHESMVLPGTLSAGMHVDKPGGKPHADHNSDPGFDATIFDTIFDTRKAYKSAKTDAEILAVYPTIAEIQGHLRSLDQSVKRMPTVDKAVFQAYFTDAMEAATLIDKAVQEGNVETTRELIARFDKNLLEIEEMISHRAPAVPTGMHVDSPGGKPHAAHGAPAIPKGMHVDSPGGKPHAAHGAPAVPKGMHVHSPGGKPHAAHGAPAVRKGTRTRLHVDSPGGKPHAAHDTPAIPKGMHVDTPGGKPHAAH
jgi:hypothetical protein